MYIIKSALFVKSSAIYTQCPPDNKPEFAFIGRSNVGKSSLINYITGYQKLAKTSAEPGKTQTINHFIINDSWYLVDLPGYGYARVSKEMRSDWTVMLQDYLLKRENLIYTYVLVDSRLEPQKKDVEFINWLGMSHIPFALIFTKIDKNTANKTKLNVEVFKRELLKYWDELPPIILSSAEKRQGREEILEHIDQNALHFDPKKNS